MYLWTDTSCNHDYYPIHGFTLATKYRDSHYSTYADADTHQKNIAQDFILERYFFVSIYPAVIPGTYLMVFLVVALLLCLLHQIYIQRS